jgi:hypothetical protein
MRTNERNWEPIGIASIAWIGDRQEVAINRFAEIRRAIRVVKAWATPLFRLPGSYFEIRHIDGYVRASTIGEIGSFFDLTLATPKPTIKRAAKPRTQAAPSAPTEAIVTTAPPTPVLVPAVPTAQ